MPSKIEWTGETWQISDGCSLESPGCFSCYAMDFAHRGLHERHRGLTVIGQRGPQNVGPVWTGEVRPFVGKLDQPLKWKRSKTIFVNSMSDIFHEKLPFEHIAAVFGIMAATPQHTYQVLTKRPKQALAFFAWLDEQAQAFLDHPSLLADHGQFAELIQCWSDVFNPGQHRVFTLDEMRVIVCIGFAELALTARDRAAAPADDLVAPYRQTAVLDEDPDLFAFPVWPLRNVWMGVSAEDQRWYDRRVGLLRQIPAALRWVSVEPQLGPIEMGRYRGAQPALPGTGVVARDVDWMVIGGESGRGARAFRLDWARSLLRQAKRQGVAVFIKQFGAQAYDTCEFCNGTGNGPFAGASEPLLCQTCGGLRELPVFAGVKGGEIELWPEELRVREFPVVAVVGLDAVEGVTMEASK